MQENARHMPDLNLPLSESIASAAARLTGVDTPAANWVLQDEGQSYRLWPQSVQAMMVMGLGSWPLSAIAIPEALSNRFYRPQTDTRELGVARAIVLPSRLITLLDSMGSHLSTLNRSAYVVGGLVRDAVLAVDSATPAMIESPDVDITVEGQAIEVATALQRVWPAINVSQVFPAFGTAKLDVDTQPVDMASTRLECYEALGALPTMQQLGVPLTDDVMRRDFTVNTLALAVHEPGVVWDSLGGLADLKSRVLRILTPHSCYEDPSRILRAFKYAMRLDFQWSEDTQYVIEQSLAHIAAYASQAQPPFEGGGERVRIEWDECLALPESSVKTQWLSRFFELGAWRVMVPSLPASAKPVISPEAFAQALTQTADKRAQDDSRTADLYWLLCLLTMPDYSREQAMTRLGCRKVLMEAVTQCSAYLKTASNPFDQGLQASDSVGIVELCSSVSPLALWFLALTSQSASASAAIIDTYTHSLAAIQPELTGRDLQAMGVLPGPRMGELLKGLLHAKLQGNLVTVSDERDWIQRQLSDSPN